MIKGLNSFIGSRIGTTDGEYDLTSKYIMVELGTDIEPTDFPAGFEGYYFKDWAMSATTTGAYDGIAPEIFYKTSYDDDERYRKVYLGISENGYDATSLEGTGINQNFFNYNGKGGFVNSKGFHMDSGATGTYDGWEFEVGAGQFQTARNVLDPTNPYYEEVSRKFTLVPAGGFDGWDVNNGVNGVGFMRSYGDLYAPNAIYDGVAQYTPPMTDFMAWQTAINTFDNPESVTINVFATPGINWSDQNVLIQDTIEMMEDERTDTLYVIDAPNIDIPQVIGGDKADVLASNEVVDLLDAAEIDTSYACTYFPWIQMRDTQNNVNIFLPPTGEVTAAMAFTDNTKFPWFAPAGLNRGVTDARKSRYKLSLEARDILYKGRINPMADFADAGTAIFGQKTLQVKESALDRINVRRLLLQIKVLIANIAIRLVF